MRPGPVLIGLFLSTLILFGFLAMSPSITAFSLTAAVDIKPDTLNVNMKGRWITAYIGLPQGYKVSDIDPSTILLEGLFKAEWSNIEGEVLMVKFDASIVTDYLWGKLYHMGVKRAPIELKVTGQLKDGADFSGSDTLTAINP